MSWRTVIISNQAKLDYKMGYMVVRGLETKRILVNEIAILLIENPMVSITGCLLEVLTEKKVKVIFCDSKRNPFAELVPHHGSHDSSLKIRTQIAWTDDVKAMIWRDIITEKIRKQSDFLKELGKDNEADLLMSYIGQVELLDATNREGHAAKVYFNALFGKEFTRSEDNSINAALNYGYSIILSAFTREISANGYLTQIGIFHSNMFNHFNLASDLMEPFRIIVDKHVLDLMPKEFGKDEKHLLWNILSEQVYIDNCNHSLDIAIKIYTKSVFDAINDNDSSRIKFYRKNEWI
ncbi:CRISPR-associated endonuclease Cas1 [Acetitomaculum ruminis DSM 5522]|uniref:CRISPR-associated endonuclease Cas1 n=1 Tax=Acetitomaculum ruminis DSM 5522 TaxID=1120918 RepID=A0A1I1ASF2_9FIRM|nr:type II CRISPR-associated endonuclease Cas1 [Acetitomaculum ruminis]SFB39253.1 CRISPR-associated endonuclease Cas1 [Acetitomaculum ruminis DSM 5522]